MTLGLDLGVAGASTDEVYAAMDWLVARQDGIERAARPAASARGRHRHVRPVQLVGGRQLLRAGRVGPICDGKRGKPQIEYGLLTDPEGRPVAVRVFAGNTGDPKTFPQAVGWLSAAHSGCSR